MTTPGSLSTIFASTQKLLQAKAQKAWKELASPAAATSQPAQANSSSTPVGTLISLIDPEAREKMRALQQDAESLTQKLTAGTESRQETAMRKAEDAKRRLKSLKMQAQMAAAAGDTKAAARIAREVAQVAKELGQAVKEYGGSNTDAMATAGTISAASQQTATALDGGESETPATGSGPAASGAVGDMGEGGTGREQQTGNQGDEYPASDDNPADTVDEAPSVIVNTLAQPATAPATAIGDKRAAIMKEGAQRKVDVEFYSDTRGTMAQLRSILEQMKKVARREGTVGMAAQMEQASRDMAEGERLLTEAASPGIIALPSGSLVQVSV